VGVTIDNDNVMIENFKEKGCDETSNVRRKFETLFFW
jgi:hypothetical protein